MISRSLFTVFLAVMAGFQLANATVSVKIYSMDEGMSNSNISKPRIYIQNTGTETINDFTYRYFITPEGSYTPLIDPYYLPNSTVALVPYGDGYYVQYTVTGANLAPGGILPSSTGNVIGLYYSNWDTWDKTNDFSNNLSETFAENQNISLYYNGSRIYGNEPGTASGSVMREVWTSISGTSTDNIDLNATPWLSTTQENLDGPVNIADNYGVRLRGYITAPVTGEYTFWLASDDNGKFWLSTNDEPANKGVPIATVPDWTDHQEWNKFESQKSDPVSLVAGTRYYIEILHKEGSGGDNCAVGWAKPGQSTSAPSEVVPTSVLSPYVPAIVPAAPTNLAATSSSAQRIDLSWTDAASNELGYIVDMAQGSGEFAQAVLLGADQSSWQATGLSPETEYRFRVYAYNLSGNSSYSAVVTATTHALAAGSVTQEVWEEITGWGTEDIPVNDPPASINELTSLESFFQSKDYYGQRIRGYIIPPVTGNYTFFIASDDYSKLWLSTNDLSSSKNMIAWVNGYTNSQDWYKYESQTSDPVALTAGVRYYVEILHKEGAEGDNCAVAWLKPGESGPPNVITAEYLSPFMLPIPPSAAPSGLAATPISATQIDLSWMDNTNNEDRFIIERALAGTGSFVQVGIAAENAAIFHDAGLQANTQYDYRIKAQNDYGSSDYSTTATAITLDNTSGAPPSTELFAFAVYSSELTNLRDRCLFDGGGAVGSNTEVEVAAEATVNGNVLSGGTVALRSQATINGDVMAAEGVTIDAGAVVNGTVNENATVAIVEIPEKENIPTGTEDVDVALDEVRPMLAPGYYKEFIVRARGKITLGAGRYTFEEFFLEPDAEIELDIQASDMVEIDVVGDVEFSDRSKMVFKDKGYIPFVRLYTNDDNMVRIGCQVELNGILTAPHGDIHMYSGAQCNGALYGKTITVEPDAVILSGMVNPETDSDGDGIPNLLEVVTNTDPEDPDDYKLIAVPHPLLIDNSDPTDVTYIFDPIIGGRYVKPITITIPANSLTLPYVPPIIQLINDPPDSTDFSCPGYVPVGRYIKIDDSNPILPGASIIMKFPIDNVLTGSTPVLTERITSGADPYQVIPGSGSNGDEITGGIGGGGGGQGNILMPAQQIDAANPEKISVYLDGGMVFSNQEYSRLYFDIMINELTSPMPPVGQLTVTYKDYSDGGAGVTRTHTIVLISPYEKLIMYGRSFNLTRPGPIEITGMTIDVPDEGINYTYPIRAPYRIEKGTGMHIVVNKTSAQLRNSRWKGDRIELSRCPNDVAIESARMGGEGRIKVSYSLANNSQLSTYDYFLKDHLGSTRMVLDETGAVNEMIMYQPYGSMSAPPGSATSSAIAAREQFTGKEFDEEGADAANGGTGIGRFYFGARYYDADVGVWNSADRKRQFWNPYAYMGNGINPIIGIDPDGRYVIYAAKSAYTGNTIGYRVHFVSQGEQAFKASSIVLRGPWGITAAVAGAVSDAVTNGDFELKDIVNIGSSIVGSKGGSIGNFAGKAYGLTDGAKGVLGADPQVLINAFNAKYQSELYHIFPSEVAAMEAIGDLLAEIFATTTVTVPVEGGGSDTGPASDMQSGE